MVQSGGKRADGPEIELDHIGVAVESLSQACDFWRALGWEGGALEEDVPSQKVRVGFLPVRNDANIELLESTDPQGTISRFLEKKGPGIHHICFRVKDISSTLARLKERGVRLINEDPVPGAHGCRVAFIHPSATGGILIELSQRGEGSEA